MGGNFGGHDPRFTDLAAIVALLIVVVGGYCYCSIRPVNPTTTAFIVPGQTTRW
ncbi:MAG: hypothetical protein JSS22_00610 [Proteobacteria bacterium]|nr:hypothetical protein [Pseudomonadota bacterium]